MLTINGVPTESFQDVVINGDLEVDGTITKNRHHEVTYEGEVVTYEGEVVTYTDQE